MLLYQATNSTTHIIASSSDTNGLLGYCGQYFSVLNSDSENGLSSLTEGRLNEGTIPSICNVASIVEPFIGPPLSEWRVTSPSRRFSATYALETTLACGYSIAQYFGWQWGKFVAPKDDARFHLSLILTLVAAAAVLLSRADPVKLTEFVIVLSAAALPLTYFPVLVVANDPEYMGVKTNTPVSNALGVAFLVLLLVVSVAAVPLMIITKAGG